MEQLRTIDEQTNTDILLGFEHAIGRHCGSTALRDVVNYAGWPLSEGACFGLASGLAYYFKPPVAEIPLGIFMGRCRNLETNFFENCGIAFQRREFPSFHELEVHIQKNLQRGFPILLQGDVAGLPYYKSPMHFPGHKFVVCGFDEGRYTIADTAFPGLQVVSADELEKTTSYQNAMWAGAFIAYDFAGQLPELTIERAVQSVRNSVARQIAELTIADESFFLSGKAAHDAWLANANFSSMSENPSIKLGAQFFYQVIEKRGTGGGAFRGIYLDFVNELLEDRLFPFAVHEALFRSPAQAVKLLTDLQVFVRQSQQTLSEIASTYKNLSLRKNSDSDGERRLQLQLLSLWRFETGITDVLLSLKNEFR